MAKRKASIRSKPGTKPARKSWWRQLLRFIASPPVGRLTLITILVALLFWQWSALTSWASNIGNNTLKLFGWGLVFIVVAGGAVAGARWRRQLSALARRYKLYQWNRWLGGSPAVKWGFCFSLTSGLSTGALCRRSIVSQQKL